MRETKIEYGYVAFISHAMVALALVGADDLLGNGIIVTAAPVIAFMLPIAMLGLQLTYVDYLLGKHAAYDTYKAVARGQLIAAGMLFLLYGALAHETLMKGGSIILMHVAF